MKRLALIVLPLALAACGSGGSPTPTITVPPSKTYQLVDRSPSKPVTAGKPTTVGFTVRLPSGKPLTKFKTGAGPHTGIHVIVVKDDLSNGDPL